MEESLSKPTGGKQIVAPAKMNDPRWPGSEGWEKIYQNINGVEVHYNYNTRTGAIDDAKFKDYP